MNQFSDFYRLLKVKTVPCAFKHYYVFTFELGELSGVKLYVVEDLPLERLGSVKHQARSLECLAQVGKTVNVFLILINGL